MGEIISYNDIPLNVNDTYEIINDIFKIANKDKINILSAEGEIDFSFSISQLGRFRVSVYMQRNSWAAVIRVVFFDLPNPDELRIPNNVLELYKKQKGLVLVTGPAGSGKSTTLACIVDKINNERNCHIMTFEDPIEFIHKHKKSIVSQREISTDSKSYINSLRASLRQAPDVILIGEMRDLETIEIALTAAETGHLVLSSLHTMGAVNTIDRIIDVFPANQQQQVRIQLSMQLQAVVSQQLIQSPVQGRVAAFEIMHVDNAISNLIRNSKVHQLNSFIHAGESKGMKSMDSSIIELYNSNLISKENAILHSMDSELMKKKL